MTPPAEELGRATGTSISYSQFPPPVLAASSLLKRLVELVDAGEAVGNADISALRRLYPELLTFDAWLAGPGRGAVSAAIGGTA